MNHDGVTLVNEVSEINESKTVVVQLTSSVIPLETINSVLIAGVVSSIFSRLMMWTATESQNAKACLLRFLASWI
jgi:hypothetical protein